MAPFEKDIFDQAVINAVNLERLSQGLQRKIIGMLLQAQREIIAEIVDTDPTAVKATNWKKARMARLTKQINDILNKNYKNIHLTVMKELVALASLEATYTAQQLNKLIGVDLFQVTLTEDYLKSIVENTLIQGGTIKEWFNTQALNAKQRLSRTLAEAVYKSNVLQMGMVKGESVNELTRAVKGIKVESRSGPLGLAQREAEALVRTSVMQVANQTRYAMYMGNKDLIKGFKLIAVLDSRTTPFCQAADQGEYDINWNPISPKAVIVLGPPPYHFNCFINRQTNIYTSTGWKYIKDIKVDDLVLTHKGRFRKVTQLLFDNKAKVNSNIVTIFLAYKKRKYWTKITVTEDHPVLINGEWKKAKDIKVGDKISYLANRCGHCGKLIPHYMKYCSYSCRSFETNKAFFKSDRAEAYRKKRSENTKAQLKREYENGTRDRYLITKAANEVIRQMVKKGIHPLQKAENREKGHKNRKPESNKNQSERMKINNPMWMDGVKDKATVKRKQFIKEHPDKHMNRIMAKKGFISSLEVKMKSILDEIGITYDSQHPIDRFFVDFGIVDLKVAIECDGEHWHTDPEKDLMRQSIIESNGWTVLRFTGNQIINSPLLVKEELIRVLCNHVEGYDFIEAEVETVTYRKLKKVTRLYNFSVEEDESYVANGVIVHNCRTSYIALLKSFEEIVDESMKGASSTQKRLAKALDQRLSEIGERASEQGPVASNMNYNEWLKTQPKSVQIDVLGRGRQKIWEDKGLSVSDLLGQKGRPLTLKELREKYKL